MAKKTRVLQTVAAVVCLLIGILLIAPYVWDALRLFIGIVVILLGAGLLSTRRLLF